MSDLLNTTGEAMKRLKFGRTKVYELMASGELESVKVGRSRRIPEAALLAYVEKLRDQAKVAV